MITFLFIVCLGLGITLAVYVIKNKKLWGTITQREHEIAVVKQEMIQLRKETEQSVENAQKLIDEEIANIGAETDRIRQHYEDECRRRVEDTLTQLSVANVEMESYRRFHTLHDAENEVRQTLSTAISEATALRTEAQSLLDQSRSFSESERLTATEKARAIYEQADARLNQATRDAGRIVADAEVRAKEIAGDAYDALRDKQSLERAAVAIRNTIEGYGDRYLIPTHSLLDDLAIEFGYTSAGESLKSARELSRRMVEQAQAATCDYAEANRRGTAIRFVTDAFNGRVDGILTRVKRDNYGQLEQEIRDTFNLVNLNGQAFRNARILDAYLNARLDELKWATVVQELARRQLDEQREIKARIRDEEKARREYEQQIRQAAKEEEIKRKALEEKERELAAIRLSLEYASAQDKAQLEQKIADIQDANEGLRHDLAAATERKLTIAQQTKTGTVYVISNIGAFGEGIYKIGQTRRPDPQERIYELSDASVPFDFDVHAWIKSDNAPVLEHRIQKSFLTRQVNKVNSRKEFFRVSLEDIRKELDRIGQSEPLTIAHWTDVAAATHYRESLEIEGDPQKLEKWLARQNALVDRTLRLDSLRLTASDVADVEVQEETA